MVYIGFKAPDAIPGRAYFTVRAQFKDADNVSKHSQVRIAGRIVGQVLDPHVEHELAVVKLQMDPTVKPLRSDTRVVVRPRSAVGVRYIDVVPGKPADVAGVAPDMKLVAVNGRKYSDDVLRDAIAATKQSGRIELLCENKEFYRTYTLDYHEGHRYPALTRDTAVHDYVSEILAQQAK